jgi:hypothetical protein
MITKFLESALFMSPRGARRRGDPKYYFGNNHAAFSGSP